MSTADSTQADETWRMRGQEDAPVAHRAITRSMFEYGKGNAWLRGTSVVLTSRSAGGAGRRQETQRS